MCTTHNQARAIVKVVPSPNCDAIYQQPSTIIAAGAQIPHITVSAMYDVFLLVSVDGIINTYHICCVPEALCFGSYLRISHWVVVVVVGYILIDMEMWAPPKSSRSWKPSNTIINIHTQSHQIVIWSMVNNRMMGLGNYMVQLYKSNCNGDVALYITRWYTKPQVHIYSSTEPQLVYIWLKWYFTPKQKWNMRAENVNDCVYDINPIDDAVYSKCMLEWCI